MNCNRILVSAFIVTLTACGTSNEHSTETKKTELSLVPTDSDYQIIKKKQNEFQDKAKHYVGCLSSVTSNECIAGLDKLLALATTTSLFPSELFQTIFITKTTKDVDVYGDLEVDFAATVEQLKMHFTNQPIFFKMIMQKGEMFKRNANHDTGCFSSLTLQECIVGLDKLIELSTTSLFPTERFENIYITKSFADVDSYGSVLVDFSANTQKLKEHLEKQ